LLTWILIAIPDQVDHRFDQGDFMKHQRASEQAGHLQVDAQLADPDQLTAVQLRELERVGFQGQAPGIETDLRDRGIALQEVLCQAGQLPLQKPGQQQETGQGIDQGRDDEPEARLAWAEPRLIVRQGFQGSSLFVLFAESLANWLTQAAPGME
jgi:hypothetical protein